MARLGIAGGSGSMGTNAITGRGNLLDQWEELKGWPQERINEELAKSRQPNPTYVTEPSLVLSENILRSGMRTRKGEDDAIRAGEGQRMSMAEQSLAGMPNITAAETTGLGLPGGVGPVPGGEVPAPGIGAGASPSLGGDTMQISRGGLARLPRYQNGGPVHSSGDRRLRMSRGVPGYSDGDLVEDDTWIDPETGEFQWGEAAHDLFVPQTPLEVAATGATLIPVAGWGIKGAQLAIRALSKSQKAWKTYKKWQDIQKAKALRGTGRGIEKLLRRRPPIPTTNPRAQVARERYLEELGGKVLNKKNVFGATGLGVLAGSKLLGDNEATQVDPTGGGPSQGLPIDPKTGNPIKIPATGGTGGTGSKEPAPKDIGTIAEEYLMKQMMGDPVERDKAIDEANYWLSYGKYLNQPTVTAGAKAQMDYLSGLSEKRQQDHLAAQEGSKSRGSRAAEVVTMGEAAEERIRANAYTSRQKNALESADSARRDYYRSAGVLSPDDATEKQAIAGNFAWISAYNMAMKATESTDIRPWNIAGPHNPFKGKDTLKARGALRPS